MSIKSYKDLVVWQKSIALVEEVYVATEKFPEKEKYRLINQICRAAISIPSNIAEGSSRKSTKEFLRFIRVSQGSVAECETQLIISTKLGYIDDSDFSGLYEKLKEISVMLHFLYNSLKRKESNSDSQILKLSDSQ